MYKTSKLWNELVEFQAVKELEYGSSEGLLSLGFMAVEDLNNPEYEEELLIYIRNALDGHDQATINKALSSFVYFAQASGDGGSYAFMVNNDSLIDENPVVFFDTDGYDSVVAQNFKELLTLLSIDSDPAVGYDDGITSYYRDEEDYHSDEYDEFIVWLKQRNIPIIENDEDYDNIATPIITNAVNKYGKQLNNIFQR